MDKSTGDKQEEGKNYGEKREEKEEE